MQLRHTGSVRTRAVAALAALATGAALLTAIGPASATPPPNPSDNQIQQAQNTKAALATKIGNLQAKYTQLTVRYHQAQAAAELAEQKAALAYQKLQQAQQAATQAKGAATQAQRSVVAAQQEFVAYAQASYMSGSVEGMTGTLLTADDPSALLQQSAIQGYQASHQLGAISDLQRATVLKSNADAAARRAVVNQTTAANAAEQAKQNAIVASNTAKAQRAQMSRALAETRTQLQSAQQQLIKLNGERAAWVTWHKHQVALRKARERRERLARERAAQLAAQQAQQNQSNNSGGGSYTGPPQGGSWSAARGQEAVARAMRWVGTIYAWAGGNAYGPTRGVCAGDGAWNDCNVVGFDCSGLVMYAWGPYLSLDHYAATQYNQAGSYHPGSGDFQPGDLLFWSSNGTVGGIHHVAIYIGNGMVVQAPESGARITTTPWDQVSWGYFGATRPLT